MANTYRSMPPLSTLRTFEAVARKGSFTRAAQDLSITQSAVSHQIRALEQFLGTPLFRRLNPGIDLTEDGKVLLDGARTGMDIILRASDRIRGRQQSGVLTVSAPSAFASWWLVPRLGRFAALHPQIEVRIATMDHREPDFTRDGIDVAIVSRLASAERQKNEMLLLRERIFPVCSPALLEGRSKFQNVEDIHSLTLIEEDSGLDDGSNWATWLDRLGVPDAQPVQRLRFSHYGVALSAALDGLGVALGRSPMIDAELAAGRLVQPFGSKHAAMASHIHALTWPDRSDGDQRFNAFRDFVLDEACGCELAAGPCGAPPPLTDVPTINWAPERAARRKSAIAAI